MIWKTKKLGEICEIIIGRTPSRDKKDYWGNGFDWASISDMNGVYISSTKEQITGIAVKECGCKLIPTGTLLMSFKLSVGKLTFNTKPIYTNEAIVALPIIKDNLIDKTFLYYALKVANLLKNVDRAAKGVTLNKKKLELIEVPLPPLEIQKRIASILDKADRLRQLRKAAIEKLDQLTQSVFLDMFGQNAANFQSLKFVSIQDLAMSAKNSMRTGPFGSDLLHSEFTDEGILVMGIDNAVNNRFEWRKKRCITSEKYRKLTRYTLYPGDVIITIMGTVGRSAVIPEDIPLSINSKHLAAITLNKEIANPYFISFSIHSNPYILHQIKSSSRGAIMGGLNLSIIKCLKLKLPTIDLQNRFAKILKKVEKARQKMQKSLEEMNNLFHSLMQQAFKGELRFNDELLASMIQAKEDILLMNDALPGKLQK